MNNEYVTFGEAIEALKQGKKVTRKIWGGYWYLDQSISIGRGEVLNDTIIAKLKDDGGFVAATAYQEDILAEDWMILE